MAELQIREALRRAIEQDDLTRAGYLKALTGIKGWTGGGISQPLSFDTFPYMVGTKTRVLKPDFKKQSWEIIADYANPQ